MLRFKNLGSGSAGNATVVEGSNGLLKKRLLVDCGLGLRALDGRLAQAGLMASEIHGIFITHEHSDHLGCARQFALKHQIPIWMSHGTHAAAGQPDFGDLLNFAQDGVEIDLVELSFTPFTVPHDAREPLQLSCSDGARRLGVLTDLGHSTDHVLSHLSHCHALLLECNHDASMLERSAYPAFLKRRIAGRHGHLSNEDSAQIAKSLNHAGLAHVIAAHLSKQNNRPELAQAALALALDCNPADVGVATQSSGFDWVSI